ncbi:MAG: UvrD-helicase domain-containing protein [Candidatus Korobacteraceae bacterium]
MALQDSSFRRRALAEHGSTLLIEAGAGTGKTALMAGRVVLLLASGVPPRSIAAITFTELAASELLLRVTEYAKFLATGTVPEPLLDALPDGFSPEQTQHLAEGGSSLDELTCTTIHGFCQRLIKPYPVECSMDPGATVMNEADTQLAYEFEFNAWLRQRLNTDSLEDPLSLAVVKCGDAAVELLRDLAEIRRRWRGTVTEVPQVPSAAVQELLTAIDQYIRYYDSCAIDEPEKVGLCATEFAALRRYYSSGLAFDDPLLGVWNFSQPPRVSSMYSGRVAFKELKGATKFRGAGRKLGKSQAECDRIYGEIEKRHVRVGDALTKVVEGCAEHILARLVADVGDFDERYLQYKRSAALIDFDDMLYVARDLLRDNPAVREDLRRRYTHVLVDEFQDTDPIQCEILFHLCSGDRGGTSWIDQPLRPGALFLVGDPKQSIYRFRRADIVTYQRVRECVQVCGGAVVPVTANFRSRPQVLEFVNSRFASPLANLGFAALQATVGDAAGVLHVSKFDVTPCDEEKDSADKRRLREAGAVAELCTSVVGRLTIRTRTGERACQFGDIALLAPSSTKLWIYERALEELGVPIATQAGKGLFLRQEIHDLIAVARVLSSSRDTLALGAVLRGPLVGLTEEELLDVVEALPTDSEGNFSRVTLFTPCDQVCNAVTREVLGILQGLARRAYNTTPYDILSAAIDELRVRPLIVQRHTRYAERALSNIDQFLEMARPFGTRGLRSFAQFVTQRWRDNERVPEGRGDAALDAIPLVSIHSAKGLEWPVVVAVNMVTEAGGERASVLYDAQRNAICARLPGLEPSSFTTVKQAEEAQQAEERKRLWYVLCTRARDFLFLPHHTNLDSRCWFNEVELNIPSLPTYAVAGSTLAATLTAAARTNEQDAVAFVAEAGRVVVATRDIRWLTPSSAEPDESAIRQPIPEMLELVEGTTEVRGSAARGRILHKLMEEVLNGLTADTSDALAARAVELVQQLGFVEVASPSAGLHGEEIANSITRTLTQDLVQRFRSSLVPEFSVFGLSHSDEHLDACAGVADAVALNSSGNPDFVFDWKSTVSPTPDDMQKHAAQLRVYLNQLNVEKGALVYMTTGQVVEVTRATAAGA